MHWTEAEELAAIVLGLDPDDSDSSEVDNKMADVFGIDMETFQKVAEALVPFTIAARPAMSERSFCGFVHNGTFICKHEVSSNAKSTSSDAEHSVD